jgi:IS5 family transposase
MSRNGQQVWRERGAARASAVDDRGTTMWAVIMNSGTTKKKGVKVVCIPQRGGKKTVKRKAYERSAAFKKGQRFRAGIEGRISVLFRGRGMKRCLAEGRQRFEVLVGAAVLANNLMRIAAMLSKRSSRRRRAA